MDTFKPLRQSFRGGRGAGTDVAETGSAIYMLEPSASNKLDDPIVLAKKEAAVKWCAQASDYAGGNGGKPWRYALIPHDEIAENMTLDSLAARFG